MSTVVDTFNFFRVKNKILIKINEFLYMEYKLVEEKFFSRSIYKKLIKNNYFNLSSILFIGRYSL